MDVVRECVWMCVDVCDIYVLRCATENQPTAQGKRMRWGLLDGGWGVLQAGGWMDDSGLIRRRSSREQHGGARNAERQGSCDGDTQSNGQQRTESNNGLVGPTERKAQEEEKGRKEARTDAERLCARGRFRIRARGG